MSELKELKEGLFNIQQELKAPKNQVNTFGDYNYRSCEDILEAVKPLLKKEGLILTLSDEVKNIGTKNYVCSVACITDGVESIKTIAYAREADTQKGMNDSQITGSSSSYARKYALNGLFAIDDTKDADTRDNSEPSKSVSNMMTDAQKRKIFALYSEKGIEDKIGFLKSTTGKNSHAVLTKTDASKLIEELVK